MDIGVDITGISRFKNRKERFVNCILTEEELRLYHTLSEEKKPVFLATRWACKEAIFKATQNKNYLQYSILNDTNGKPYVQNEPKMHISISHESDTVIAFVVIE